MDIPNSLLDIFTSPLRSVLLSSILKEPFRPSNRSQNLQDESVDSFLTRRFGKSFARVFGSALVHGIYAADSRMISVRAAFQALWDAEEIGSGSVVRGFLHPGRLLKRADRTDYELGTVPELMNGVSVYSFREGISTITNALVEDLRRNPRVHIEPENPVSAIRVKNAGDLEVVSATEILNPTHIVSALPLPILHKVLPPRFSLPHLLANPSSSVTVVNLVFPKSLPLPEGFGYLIPRPPHDGQPLPSPVILGTVFDSCALSAQDQNPGFSKMTVMLKGANDEPESTLMESIISQLSHHLALPELKPVYARIIKNESCIPVLMPGHLERMTDLKKALQESPWFGRLEVVGAGVGGVSVGDCIEAGKRAGSAWKNI